MKALLIFLVTTSYSLAQNKISIAPTYWFNYANQDIKYADPYAPNSTITLSAYSWESSIGLTVHYQLGPNWTASGGLLYNKAVLHSTHSNRETVNVFNCYQLPILINYKPSKHSLSPYFSGGIFLDNNETGDGRSIKPNVMLGIGLNYQFNSKLSLLVQPMASYLFGKPITAYIINLDTNTNPYKIGVQTQLIWHL